MSAKKSFCAFEMERSSKYNEIFFVSAYMYYGMSGRDFDPRMRAFSDEELKPQVMVKKSRKKVIFRNKALDQNFVLNMHLSLKFVPDDMKDDKYWARRRKNNIAAKRSRDARRVKENQIALRAGFLEKEVNNLAFLKVSSN